MDVSILEITDGTTTVDLLTNAVKRKPGVKVTDWKPNIPDYKDGGSWADSPIADGRIPVFGRRGNVVDSFAFSMDAADTDKIAVIMQELFRLIEKGNQYWLGSYSLEPVWIKAQSPCETNPRYALVYRATVPELGFPYSGGFLSRGASFMRDLTLVVEHGPWCNAPPTQPACIPANTLFPSHYAAYINMEGFYVNCGSDAGLDNLADNAFTAEGWFCADLGDYGGALGTSGALIEKGTNSSHGWYFIIDSTVGLWAEVDCATTNARSTSGLDEYTADGEWHHVAMTFDDAGTRKIRLWLDGAEIVSYATQIAGVGAINADAAENLTIGDIGVALNQNFHGKVGWVRISNNLRYTVAFTPAARCTVPATDANTLGLWGGSGTGTTLYSQEGTTARNGTITESGTPPLPVWGWDCDTDFGRVSTCLLENFVMSGWQPWQLTHIYHYTAVGAVWSANLLAGNPPYAILPAAPANGDFIYFGIEGGAPFSNLIFDLSTVATTSTIALQEHQGAINANTWAAVAAFIDTTSKAAVAGTNALTNAGVGAITWFQGTSWTIGNLFQIFAGTAPPITAKWIRLAVTAYTGGTVTQQHRHIYTQTRPDVDIIASDTPGDIPLDLRMEILQPKGNNNAPDYTCIMDDVLVGLRSYDRDADYFQPYINLADTGNMAHITITAVAPATVTARAQAKVGRCISYAPAGAGTAIAGYVVIDSDYLRYFTGTFRVFLRHYVTGTPIPTAYISYDQPYDFQGNAVSLVAREYSVADLGTISIPPRSLFGYDMTIFIRITATAAGATVYLYDLVLFPIDEMAVRARANALTLSPATGVAMIFDDITYPRDGLTAFLGLENTDAWWAPGYVVTNQPPILQANKHQRLIFMASAQPAGGNTSCYGMLAAVGLSGLSRYLGLRGAR